MHRLRKLWRWPRVVRREARVEEHVNARGWLLLAPEDVERLGIALEDAEAPGTIMVWAGSLSATDWPEDAPTTRVTGVDDAHEGAG